MFLLEGEAGPERQRAITAWHHHSHLQQSTHNGFGRFFTFAVERKEQACPANISHSSDSVQLRAQVLSDELSVLLESLRVDDFPSGGEHVQC